MVQNEDEGRRGRRRGEKEDKERGEVSGVHRCHVPLHNSSWLRIQLDENPLAAAASSRCVPHCPETVKDNNNNKGMGRGGCRVSAE